MAEPRPRPILYDAAALAPDLATVDWLARLALLARQNGLELHVSRPSGELAELLALAGLAGVLRVEFERQAEERE